LDGIERTHLLGGSGLLLAAGDRQAEVAKQLGVDACACRVRIVDEVTGELTGELDCAGVGRREPRRVGDGHLEGGDERRWLRCPGLRGSLRGRFGRHRSSPGA
jgi:hypothetical protein